MFIKTDPQYQFLIVGDAEKHVSRQDTVWFTPSDTSAPRLLPTEERKQGGRKGWNDTNTNYCHDITNQLVNTNRHSNQCEGEVKMIGFPIRTNRKGRRTRKAQERQPSIIRIERYYTCLQAHLGERTQEVNKGNHCWNSIGYCYSKSSLTASEHFL